MTDGRIYYDEYGNEIKAFNVKDAAGFFAAYEVGIKVIILTGRESMATTRRMKELKVDYIFQNIRNKSEFLKQFLGQFHIDERSIGYIGDDMNDLAAMKYAAFIGCPSDSCQEVKEIANYVSPVCGGYGAVRDVIEYLLKERQQWYSIVSRIYNCGV